MDLTRLLINETAKRENVRNRFPGGFYVRAWLRNDDLSAMSFRRQLKTELYVRALARNVTVSVHCQSGHPPVQASLQPLRTFCDCNELNWTEHNFIVLTYLIT